jgi:hypothetical protein
LAGGLIGLACEEFSRISIKQAFVLLISQSMTPRIAGVSDASQGWVFEGGEKALPEHLFLAGSVKTIPVISSFGGIS